MSLDATQTLRFSVDGPAACEVDFYIYDAATSELSAKSDDEVLEPYFDWAVAKSGRYYAVTRATGHASCSVTLRISSTSSTRGANVRPEPNYGITDVYYATDRNPAKDDGRLVEFSGDPAADGKLRFGIARVGIPRAHKMGELEGPSILKLEFRQNPGEHVAVISMQAEADVDFFARVADRVHHSAGREAIVFVHGFNVDFDEALRRTAQIAYDLEFDGAMVLYSWPSQGHLDLLSYEKDVRNAGLSVRAFREFLSNFVARTGVETVHVIAHSMGNVVAAKALAMSADNSALPVNPQRIRHVALIAPDIDAAELRQIARGMRSSADQITLYASSADLALKASAVLAGYPRAGQGGPSLIVLPEVMDTIDASDVDTSILGISHSYYADNQTILSDLFSLIRGIPPGGRIRLRTRNTPSGQYWFFVPAAR